jgi:hypothetical protein
MSGRTIKNGTLPDDQGMEIDPQELLEEDPRMRTQPLTSALPTT